MTLASVIYNCSFLFSTSETIDTVVNYNCKYFIDFTSGCCFYCFGFFIGVDGVGNVVALLAVVLSFKVTFSQHYLQPRSTIEN